MIANTELEAVPPGTRFEVPFTETIVRGIVVASAPGRVYCAMFDPATFDEATNTPHHQSRWVVEDLALWDGSWAITGCEPETVPVALPRFKALSNDGVRNFVSFNSKLYAGNLAQMTAGEETEWENAYAYVHPSIPAVLHNVAQTFGIAPITDRAKTESKDVTETRQLVGLMRRNLSPIREVDIEFVGVFPSKRAARAAAQPFADDGLQTSVERTGGSWFSRSAILVVTKPLFCSYPVIAPEQERMRAAFEKAGGTYDGFGASVGRA